MSKYYLAVSKKELRTIRENNGLKKPRLLKKRPVLENDKTTVLVIEESDLNKGAILNSKSVHIDYQGNIGLDYIYLGTTSFKSLMETNWGQRPFRVVRELKLDTANDYIENSTETTHIADERADREETYKEFDLETKEVLAAFEVDRQHIKGNEVHILFDNGIIEIFNKKTKRRVSVLHARPGQLFRYFDKDDVPAEIIDLAEVVKERNKKHNLNKK